MKKKLKAMMKEIMEFIRYNDRKIENRRFYDEQEEAKFKRSYGFRLDYWDEEI